jgi:flagellar hook protein FlgE
MGLYGVMRTSVSGMNALSNRLSAVGDNIANASTIGYKRISAEFATLVLAPGASRHDSGSVNTLMRSAISEQGGLIYTSSVSDLAVAGAGFFVVSDADGSPYLTRAGSFVPDGAGNLVNTAGYYLMGYPLADGDPAVVANGLSGMQRVNLAQTSLTASASTAGIFSANLPANADIVDALDLPSLNGAGAEYTAKTSLVSYDNLGNEVILDVYYTKTADNTWEVSVFNQADAAPGGGFPYAATFAPPVTLTFDPTTGALATGSADSIDLAIPNGATLTLDLSAMTQLASDYTVLKADVNGNAPSALDRIEISNDGTLYAIFENGTRQPTWRIPLADVPSPDNLTAVAGNAYRPSTQSGDVQVGFAGSAGFGAMVSGAVEGSTVDLASELTAMVEAQRGYTANSKVFQTASELLDVLVNLKR